MAEMYKAKFYEEDLGILISEGLDVGCSNAEAITKAIVKVRKEIEELENIQHTLVAEKIVLSTASYQDPALDNSEILSRAQEIVNKYNMSNVEFLEEFDTTMDAIDYDIRQREGVLHNLYRIYQDQVLNKFNRLDYAKLSNMSTEELIELNQEAATLAKEAQLFCDAWLRQVKNPDHVINASPYDNMSTAAKAWGVAEIIVQCSDELLSKREPQPNSEE